MMISKRHRQDVTIESVEPIPLSSSSLSSDTTTTTTTTTPSNNDQQACGICRRNQARYTCPKCRVPYCSVACYRHHNNKDNNKDDNPTSCTERFFHSRVSQILEMEVKEKRGDTQRLLNRFHRLQEEEQQQQNWLQQEHVSTVQHDDDNNNGVETSISQEDLLRLWQLLEEGKESELEKFMICTPGIQKALSSAVAAGELNDWMLQPWHPWWRPEFASTNEHGRDIDEGDDENSSTGAEPDGNQQCTTKSTRPIHEKDIFRKNKMKKTLDERLLSVPRFESLRPKKSGGSDGNRHVDDLLSLNTMELLYSIVRTLRLYHGIDNAVELAPDHAADTLFQTSLVLSNDTCRFESVSHGLMSCTGAASCSTAAAAESACCHGSVGKYSHVSWNVLARDVVGILTQGADTRRLVARALFEAMDLCKAAIQARKNTATKSDNQDEEKEENEKALQRLRKGRKKLEYYVSWSLEPSSADILRSLASEMEDWIADWEDPSCRDNTFEPFTQRRNASTTTSLPRVLLNTGQESLQMSRNQPPHEFLMKEISSSKKPD